jgi:hypothetical protein
MLQYQGVSVSVFGSCIGTGLGREVGAEGEILSDLVQLRQHQPDGSTSRRDATPLLILGSRALRSSPAAHDTARPGAGP